MIVALGIASAILIGAFNGIMLAEAMWGGPSAPGKLLTKWGDWVVERVSR